MTEDGPRFVMGSAQAWQTPSRGTARKQDPAKQQQTSLAGRLLAAGRSVLPAMLLQRLRLLPDTEPADTQHPREVSPDPRPAKTRRMARMTSPSPANQQLAAELAAAAAVPLPEGDTGLGATSSQPQQQQAGTPFTPAPPPLRVREGTLRPRNRQHARMVSNSDAAAAAAQRTRKRAQGEAAPGRQGAQTPPVAAQMPAAAGAHQGHLTPAAPIRAAAVAAAAPAQAAPQQQPWTWGRDSSTAAAAASSPVPTHMAAGMVAGTPVGAEGGSRGTTPYWTPLPATPVSTGAPSTSTAAAKGDEQQVAGGSRGAPTSAAVAAAGGPVQRVASPSAAAAGGPRVPSPAAAAAAAAAAPLRLNLLSAANPPPPAGSKYPQPFFAAAGGGSSNGGSPVSAWLGAAGSGGAAGGALAAGQVPAGGARPHLRPPSAPLHRHAHQHAQHGLMGLPGAARNNPSSNPSSASLPGTRVSSPVGHHGVITGASVPSTRVASPVGHPAGAAAQAAGIGGPPRPSGQWAVVRPLPQNPLGRYVMANHQQAAAGAARGGSGGSPTGMGVSGGVTGGGDGSPGAVAVQQGGSGSRAHHDHLRHQQQQQQQQHRPLGVSHPPQKHLPAGHLQQSHHHHHHHHGPSSSGGGTLQPVKVLLREQLEATQQQQQQQQQWGVPAAQHVAGGPPPAAAATAEVPGPHPDGSHSSRKRTSTEQVRPANAGSAKVAHTQEQVSPRHQSFGTGVTLGASLKQQAQAAAAGVAVSASAHVLQPPASPAPASDHAAAAAEAAAGGAGVGVGMQLKVELLDDDLQPNGWVVHLGVAAPLGKGTFGSTWRADTQQVSPAAAAGGGGGSAPVTPRTSARRRSLLPGQRPQVPAMVAVKVAHRFDQCEYPPGYTSDLHAADMQTTYIQEYGILAAVDSRHVVSTYGLGRLVYEDGESVLVLLLELVEGGALDTWLEQQGLNIGLQPPAAKALLQQVAQGLADLHDPTRQQHVGEQRWFHAVAHRDLKPANLLVVPEASSAAPGGGSKISAAAGGGGGGGRGVNSTGAAVGPGHPGIQLLKLADFGSAKILAHPEDSGDDMDGTPLYMAPEVAARQPHGTAADVYSLGVLYVYLRFGGRPFGYLWRQLRQRVWQWQGQWVGGLTGKRLEEADIALHIASKELSSPECPYNQQQPGGEGEGQGVVTAPALSDAERAWLQWVMAPDPQQRPSMGEVLQDSRGFFVG